MSFNFEGDEVTDFTAQLPSATLQAPEAFQRGTLLTLSVQVRVKSVRIEEDRKGNLTRKHILALEDCAVTDILTPAQRQKLIEQAETQAAVDAEPGEYTVPEEAEASDFVADYVPSGQDFNTPDAKDDEVTWDGKDTIGPLDLELVDTLRSIKDEERAVVLDDDDAEHSWMDDDEEQGVHTDVSALVG